MNYKNGPGNIPHMPYAVLDTLIQYSGVLPYTYERDQHDDLHNLQHATVEELLARLPEDNMRKHVQDFATNLGWDKDDGEGAFEYVQRLSYTQGWQDAYDVERSAVNPVLRNSILDAAIKAVEERAAPSDEMFLCNAVDAIKELKQ